MEPCNVVDMLSNHYDDPSSFTNYHKINNGGDRDSKSVQTWRIIDDRLEELEEQQNGILFDAENYIIQWMLEFNLNTNKIDHFKKETLYYSWKGHNASKGLTPLPLEIESENPVVERIYQWSEPATFFQIFPNKLIVLRGKQEDFNLHVPHLFIVRGEVPSEIHLYEIEFRKENLRSRAIFLLLVPYKKLLFTWRGLAVSLDYWNMFQENIKLNEILLRLDKDWNNFTVLEITEKNDQRFKEEFICDNSDYFSIKDVLNFTPRLFYFCSITGHFSYTEVEYPLRSVNHIAAFPFLQSHLYSADQPALFILDNNTEIWLWKGWDPSEKDLQIFSKELQCAEETAILYAKEKQRITGLCIHVKYVSAGLEPIEFTNIFPYWITKKLV